MTEFENFQKKHRDWKEVLPSLSGILERQEKARNEKRASGGFVPEWKNLSTWINQRCWEEEIPETEKTREEEYQMLEEQGELKFRHYCIKKIGGEQAWENYFSGKTCWNSEELEETQKYFWSVVLPFREKQ